MHRPAPSEQEMAMALRMKAVKYMGVTLAMV
jgi:hypothetical protein